MLLRADGLLWLWLATGASASSQLRGGVQLSNTTKIASSRNLQLAIPVPDTDEVDPLLRELDIFGIPEDAAEIGMWSPARNWPVIAIHSAVLPDGRVVSYGKSFNDRKIS